jgi:adenosylhomocysteine nucleosidase
MILAATGLERERRIVAGPGVEAIAGGGDHERLERLLEARTGEARGIISIGIAGGLAPDLQPGRWVVADTVLVDGRPIPSDSSWTERLAAHLSGAARGALLGVDAIVTESKDKAELHRRTGARAVDMESHVVARVALRHRLPFAAARVICDPAHRALPAAARVALKADGRTDVRAVLRSLLAQPSQLPVLIATAVDAERSFRSLLRGHRRLGPGLCGPDFGELLLDVP